MTLGHIHLTTDKHIGGSSPCTYFISISYFGVMCMQQLCITLHTTSLLLLYTCLCNPPGIPNFFLFLTLPLCIVLAPPLCLCFSLPSAAHPSSSMALLSKFYLSSQLLQNAPLIPWNLYILSWLELIYSIIVVL